MEKDDLNCFLKIAGPLAATQQAKNAKICHNIGDLYVQGCTADGQLGIGFTSDMAVCEPVKLLDTLAAQTLSR